MDNCLVLVNRGFFKLVKKEFEDSQINKLKTSVKC